MERIALGNVRENRWLYGLKQEGIPKIFQLASQKLV